MGVLSVRRVAIAWALASVLLAACSSEEGGPGVYSARGIVEDDKDDDSDDDDEVQQEVQNKKLGSR